MTDVGLVIGKGASPCAVQRVAELWDGDRYWNGESYLRESEFVGRCIARFDGIQSSMAR